MQLEDRKIFLDSGADLVLGKPLDMVQLRENFDQFRPESVDGNGHDAAPHF